MSGEMEVSMVYQGDRCSAFLDHQPINPGHALVVPNRHASNLAELDEEEGAQVFRVARRIAAALRNSGVKCEGVNISLADGEAAGQEVFHAHCQELDDYAKRNPKLGRPFADVSSGMKGEKSRWREFKSEVEREEADTGNDKAKVWAKDGAVALVSYAFQSPSGDWAHYVSYYFREDGTLAKIHAQLNTFYGNMTVIREPRKDLHDVQKTIHPPTDCY